MFGLVKLTSYHEVDIYTQGKIFMEEDISVYEYSKTVYENAAHFHKPGFLSSMKCL
jgi:hypothetical protein